MPLPSHRMCRTGSTALLTFEVGVRLAAQPYVTSVGEVAHQTVQGLTAAPQVAPHAAQDVRQGVEVAIADLHLRDGLVGGEMLGARHRKGQSVVPPIPRELIEGDATLHSHLLPEAGAG